MTIRIDQIKRDAKRFGKRNGVDYQTALDAVAREHGFAGWLELREAHRKQVAEDRENEPPTAPDAHLPKRTTGREPWHEGTHASRRSR